MSGIETTPQGSGGVSENLQVQGEITIKEGDGKPKVSDWTTSSIESIKKSEKENQDKMIIALPLPNISLADYTALMESWLKSGGAATSAIGALSEQEATKAMLKSWGDNVEQIGKMMQQYWDQEAMVFSVVSMAVAAVTYLGVGDAAITTVNGAVVKGVSTVTMDIRPELILFASLFTTAALSKAAWTTFAKGEVGDDVAYNKNYGEQMIAWLQGSLPGQLVQAVAKGADTARTQQLTLLVKLIMALNTLGLLTMEETGHLTAEETAEMVKPGGLIKFGAQDPRTQLVAFIQEYLASLKDNPQALEVATKVITAMLEYFETQPKKSKLADATSTFKVIYDELASKNDRLAHERT